MDLPKLNYTHINHLARIQLGLSMNEYAVADLIYHYSNNPESSVPGWCFANKKTIAGKLGLTERSVFAIITKLEDKKIVERHAQTHHLRVTSLWYRIAYTIQETPSADTHEEIVIHHEESSGSMRDSMKKLHTDHEESSDGTMKNLQMSYEETSYNNNTDNNREINIQKNIYPKGDVERLAAELFGDVRAPHVESKQESPTQMQMATSEPEEEPIVGEVVQLGEDGKPLKPGQNPDGSFGKADINEGMRLLADLLGEKPIKEELNRRALRNLYRKRGKEATLEMIQDAFEVRLDRYAPKILNYMDLWDKWEDLKLYFERKRGGVRIGNVSLDATYDNVAGGVAW